MVGEDSLVDHLDGSRSPIADQSAQKDGCVGALSEEVVHGVDILLYFLLSLRQLRLEFGMHIR